MSDKSDQHVIIIFGILPEFLFSVSRLLGEWLE